MCCIYSRIRSGRSGERQRLLKSGREAERGAPQSGRRRRHAGRSVTHNTMDLEFGVFCESSSQTVLGHPSADTVAYCALTPLLRVACGISHMCSTTASAPIACVSKEQL